MLFFKSILIITILVSVISCNGSISHIFEKRTPHEAYGRSIRKDPGAQTWFAAAEKALDTNQVIDLPYKLAGIFQSGKPRALALRFSAKQGERIDFILTKSEGDSMTIFADLYRINEKEKTHLLAIDTGMSGFGFNVEETTDYLLRLQPALYQSGEYQLSARILPSLGFPVSGSKAKTGSYWGDARDGGRRNHEGIDIFAPRKTPVVAAADGYVTRVAEGGIGGKTVWMRASKHNIHLYYAHLDEQHVSDGQSVKTGDTLGTVGNTGNAKFTPPHLHFGVYTSGGPIDPLPFVNPAIRIAPPLKPQNLKDRLMISNPRSLKDERLTRGTLLTPLAVTKDGYIVEIADGRIVQIPVNAVKPAES